MTGMRWVGTVPAAVHSPVKSWRSECRQSQKATVHGGVLLSQRDDTVTSDGMTMHSCICMGLEQTFDQSII